MLGTQRSGSPLVGKLLGRPPLWMAVSVNKGSVLNSRRAAGTMSFDMVDIGIFPQHFPLAYSTFLLVPVVNHFSFKRTE